MSRRYVAACLIVALLCMPTVASALMHCPGSVDHGAPASELHAHSHAHAGSAATHSGHGACASLSCAAPCAGIAADTGSRLFLTPQSAAGPERTSFSAWADALALLPDRPPR